MKKIRCEECTKGIIDQKLKLPHNTRRLKMQILHRGNNAYVPSLFLAGKWLEKAGFSIGDYVIVTAENGQLNLSLEVSDDDHVR